MGVPAQTDVSKLDFGPLKELLAQGRNLYTTVFNCQRRPAGKILSFRLQVLMLIDYALPLFTSGWLPSAALAKPQLTRSGGLGFGRAQPVNHSVSMCVCRLRFEKLSRRDQVAVVDHLRSLVYRLSGGTAMVTILRFDGEHAAVRESADPATPTTTQQLATHAKALAHGHFLAMKSGVLEARPGASRIERRRTVCRLLTMDILSSRFDRGWLPTPPDAPLAVEPEDNTWRWYVAQLRKLLPADLCRLRYESLTSSINFTAVQVEDVALQLFEFRKKTNQPFLDMSAPRGANITTRRVVALLFFSRRVSEVFIRGWGVCSCSSADVAPCACHSPQRC
jgi:hypothetical protein